MSVGMLWRTTDVARIVAAEVHSTVASNDDDLFSHETPKLTTPHLPYKKLEFSPSGGASYKLPLNLAPKIFRVHPCSSWLRLWCV